MAALTLPRPGTEFGPCEDHFCGHSDCEETRRMAFEVCRFCDRYISYGKRFYNDPSPRYDGALVHADCLEAVSLNPEGNL